MSQQSLIGTQLGEYKLETLLGEGGMASVYRALDVRLNRYVAIKVIRASFRADSEYTMRFEREAQAIAQLDHPNIIAIYRYDELDNLLYMVMQYVDGADLSDVIESYHMDGAFVEFEEIIRLAHAIGAGLDFAHNRGVIHRDIKPQNILIRQDGHAIVSDFGLALLTEVGTRGEIFGSPHYIAPEQAISSAGAVPQSDLYALGVIIYEMLTGTLPFDADQPLDVAMKHMTDEPPTPRSLRPELSQDVEDVILKALSKDPEDRYQSGKELAVALENALITTKPTPQSSSKTRQTIPQRVALQVEANPLPPLPSPVMQPIPSDDATVPSSAPVTQKSAPSGEITVPSSASPTPSDDITVPSSASPTSSDDVTVPSSASPTPSDDITVSSSNSAILSDVTVSSSDSAKQKSAPKTSRRPITGAIVGIILIAIIVAILLFRNSPTNSVSPVSTLTQVAASLEITSNVTVFEGENTNTITDIQTVIPPTNTTIPTVILLTNTAIPMIVPPINTIIPTAVPPTNTIIPTVVPPTNTIMPIIMLPTITPQPVVQPTQVPTVQMWTITIEIEKDGLFVLNDSVTDFPLASLEFTGEGSLIGSEWEIENLSPGQCVATWKDDKKAKKYKPKKDSNCQLVQLVGETLTRKKRERFWESDFDVSYQGLSVAICDDSPCIIEITS